jgi:hypothetical protein
MFTRSNRSKQNTMTASRKERSDLLSGRVTHRPVRQKKKSAGSANPSSDSGGIGAISPPCCS